MDCLKCNLQIPEDSKFCPHCGKNQSEDKRTVNKESITSLNTRFTRELIGFYFIWVLLHLTFLLIFAENIFPSGEDTC